MAKAVIVKGGAFLINRRGEDRLIVLDAEQWDECLPRQKEQEAEYSGNAAGADRVFHGNEVFHSGISRPVTTKFCHGCRFRRLVKKFRSVRSKKNLRARTAMVVCCRLAAEIWRLGVRITSELEFRPSTGAKPSAWKTIYARRICRQCTN